MSFVMADYRLRIFFGREIRAERVDSRLLRSAFVGSGGPCRDVAEEAWAFKIRSTESIVFQLRVVAGAPKSLSIWPR